MDREARETLAWVAVATLYAAVTVWGWTQSLPKGMTLAQALGLD